MTLPGPVATPVVFDANVLVQAIATGNSPYLSWPSPPPTSGNPFADCLGIINDAAEFALWLSPHILDNTVRVLGAVVGTPKDEAEDYRDILIEMADASGGGVLSPPRTVHDCGDHEDNLVLDLAAEVGALLIVSEDIDLTAMSPSRGCQSCVPLNSPLGWTACAGTVGAADIDTEGSSATVPTYSPSSADQCTP